LIIHKRLFIFSLFFLKVEIKKSCSGVIKEPDKPLEIYDIQLPKIKKPEIVIKDLADRLKDHGCDLNNNQILFFSEEENAYIFAGIYTEAEHSKFTIPIKKKAILKLKCRAVANKDLLPSSGSKETKKSSRRGNERRIGEVVSLVHSWKEIQKRENKTLEDAAKDLKMSKKTLDDYLKQIQEGLDYGFDFNFYRDSFMGMLRHFNSNHNARKKA